MTMQQNIRSKSLPIISQYMSILTLLLTIAMFLINFICWLFPDFSTHKLGFSFSISLVNSLNINIANMPWWQILGGIIISSLPLIVLSLAAKDSFYLFRLYAQKHYFSDKAARYLKSVGKYIIIWVVFQFLAEPILSLWITMTQPVGQRYISLGFSSADIIALFLGVFFWVISEILSEASKIYGENQSFI